MFSPRKKNFTFGLLFLFCIGYSSHAFAQPKKAQDLMKDGNYLDALSYMLTVQKSNKDDLPLSRAIAVCYLNTNINRKAALTYIEKVYESGAGEKEADIIYEYAESLTYHLKFKEAKRIFEEYKASGKGKYQDKVARNIINCDEAVKLINRPLNVTFTNLGKKVNSKFPDYYPFVSKNDSILYFTSRRTGNLGGSKEFDGYYPADIHYYLLNKDLARVKNAGKTINTTGDDQVVGLSNDGKNLFVYFDVVDQYGDIYMAENVNGNFSRNFKLSPTINTKALETSASISANGKTLFFASSRSGGQGGLDLYMSRILPDGTWGVPQNLGANVNSEFDEDFPQLSEDGSTLYFSSNGHPGMGGSDLFFTTWNQEDNVWTSPVNIGYPINTPSDNKTITFSLDETIAYVSEQRDDSYGDFDIYKVEFHDKNSSKAVFICSNDNGEPFENIEMLIIDQSGSIIGIYRPNKRGKFVSILDIGNYKIELEGDEGVIHSQSIEVKPENVIKVTNFVNFKLD